MTSEELIRIAASQGRDCLVAVLVERANTGADADDFLRLLADNVRLRGERDRMEEALKAIAKLSGDGRRTANLPVIRRTAYTALSALRTDPELGEKGEASVADSAASVACDLTAGDAQRKSEQARVCELLVTYGAIVATAYTPDDHPDRIRLTSGEIIVGEIAEVLLDMARTVTDLARLAQSALSTESDNG